MNQPLRMPALYSCMLASLLAAALCLPGCASSTSQASDAIDTVVSAQLDALKTPDEAAIKSVLPADTYDELTKYGIDPVPFYKALVSRFSYQIKGTSVSSDENSAQVSVSTTNIYLKSIASSWASDFSAYVASSDGVSAILSGDENSLVNKGITMLQDKISASDAPLTSADVTIDLVRGSDGTWAIKDQSELINALLAGTNLDDALNGINSAASTAQTLAAA